MRTCSVCKKEKSLDQFHKGTYACKPCAISRVQKHYAEHKEEKKKYGREYYQRNAEKYHRYDADRYRNNPERRTYALEKAKRWHDENRERFNELHRVANFKSNRRFSLQKHMAIHRYKREWGLTREQFIELVEKPCCYCGEVKPSMGVGLDRIDNSKGYTMGNVQPCCGDCNQLRGDRLTVEETKIAVAAVMAYRNR
jgi:hypothetical protein